MKLGFKKKTSINGTLIRSTIHELRVKVFCVMVYFAFKILHCDVIVLFSFVMKKLKMGIKGFDLRNSGHVRLNQIIFH